MPLLKGKCFSKAILRYSRMVFKSQSQRTGQGTDLLSKKLTLHEALGNSPLWWEIIYHTMTSNVCETILFQLNAQLQGISHPTTEQCLRKCVRANWLPINTVTLSRFPSFPPRFLLMMKFVEFHHELKVDFPTDI